MSSKLDELLIGQYVIVRTYSAGVFAGTLNCKEGQEVELHNARRIWSWEGACSLSQMAEEGVKRPNECRFPKEVKQVILTQVIEILKVSDEAQKIIKETPEWRVD